MGRLFAVLIAVIVVAPAAGAAPSFDCATNRSLSDRLICSDAELSKLDAEIDRAYRSAIARAGANAFALRMDQRAYNRDSLQGVTYRLNDASPDAIPPASDGDAAGGAYGRQAAIVELKSRMTDRIDVLNAFEPGRDGFEGEWRSQSGGCTSGNHRTLSK